MNQDKQLCNLSSKTLYYVLILLDVINKGQKNNETSENNQGKINVFID